MKKLLLVFAVLPLVAFADATFNRNLSLGIRGADVAALQQFLTLKNVYSGPITSFFGPMTKRAVIAFQIKEGISPASGYVGPLTRKHISQVSTSADGQSAPTTTAAIQDLENKMNMLIAQQKKEFQPAPPPTPQGPPPLVVAVASPQIPVLPKKVIYAVLSNSSVTLNTTFPIDFRSIQVVAYDHFANATSTFSLTPNMTAISATVGHDGIYDYLVPMVTKLSDLMSTVVFYTPTFQISFKASDGISTTSHPFVFNSESLSPPPYFHISDVAGTVININF